VYLPEARGLSELPTDPAAVWVPIGELRPWIGNPRKNSDAVKAVADSIRKFGFGAPIIARLADRQIIGGHTRLQAARRLGLTHVPVRYLNLSAEDAQLLALADNKLGDIAEWDEGMLARILEEPKAANADRVSLLWTDPPYNVVYEGAAGSIFNEQML
jgi:hypothetical protein